MSDQPNSRRARYHAETRDEAKEIALRQLAEGGIGAVSLNAIGKEMGITGPALYRYFANRDALLSGLIIDAYSDLAEALELVVKERGPDDIPRESLRALAEATRAWALAQPHRYLLLYGTPVPGYIAPDETLLIARRIIAPFQAALRVLSDGREETGASRAALEGQLIAWQQATEPPTSVSVLRRSLVWWARMHGLISLEIAGHFGAMGFDPALLFASEIEALLDDTGAGAG